MSPDPDEPRPPRPGEELDDDALARWFDDLLGGRAAVEIRQFPSGHSNLTYLIRRAGTEYVLRRPPFGSKVKTAHDMGREHTVLSALAPIWSKAPRPIGLCRDEAVLGATFYVMERREGTILRTAPPPGVTVDEAAARRVCEQLALALVELHAIDIRAAGLGEFGKPAGYVRRQVEGWTERYHRSRTDDLPVVLEVADWLAAHLVESGAAALIHNDWKFDNLIFDAGLHRVTAVLDWEMAALGDPLMDLGTALSYWVEVGDPPAMQAFRFGMTTSPGMMTRRDLVARYAEISGRDVSAIVFYAAFGLFKTAVVAQQIYYRWSQGLTRDPRFGHLIHAVRVLCEQASHTIRRGHL